jgi:transketolase
MLYSNDSDCRSAWGNAIADLAKKNANSSTPIVVVDCDLASSVKTTDFKAVAPEHFLQVGIMEHHAAVMSGAISTMGIQCFWAGFGVFGIDETYNMQRLNDINHTNLKTVLTHVGVDVGADGKTHQCVDYISLVRNLFDTRIICPADANQTDRVVRWLIEKSGNYVLTMGRSKLPILRNTDATPFYDQEYFFEYGKADVMRDGNQGTVFVCGTPAGRVLKAIDQLRQEGIYLQMIYVSSPLQIDPALISDAVKRGVIFSVEDHSIHGGLGSTIAEAIVAGGHKAKLIKIGVEAYLCSGESEVLFAALGMNSSSLCERFRKELK